MANLLLATRSGLLIVRRAATWTVEQHLAGRSPRCVDVDPDNPDFLYCGTARDGLWRSTDGGGTWEPAGAGIPHPTIAAIAVARGGVDGRPGAVYAGTGPSGVFRSDDRGESWMDMAGLRALPSAATWSFPPRPWTHHVRWIEADAVVAERIFVAIEAGALVRTLDGGRTWRDRVPGGPYDTHTAATHRHAPGRLYSAAGDGYFESGDAGDSWRSPEEGLHHHYLIGIAVDPAEPDTVLISAAAGPGTAYRAAGADTYVYRRTGHGSWQMAMAGLPEPRGTTASRFATHPDEPGVVYAASNRGLFRSADAGRAWRMVDVQWPQPGIADGVEAVALLPG